VRNDIGSMNRKAENLGTRTGRPLFVRRCDTPKALYELACRIPAIGSTSYTVESEAMTAAEMDAYLMGALRWTR